MESKKKALFWNGLTEFCQSVNPQFPVPLFQKVD